jgi:hypothetical protein
LQQQISRNLTFEVSHMGSEGRKLIITDIVNRVGSQPATAVNPQGRFNPSLPDIVYRSNSGSSTYAALAAQVRYRSSHLQLQASYTWSHSIDNQSDAMLGEGPTGPYAYNLNYTNPDVAANSQGLSAFTRQFDSRIDRGNSDFDIRRNLVFYSIWSLPRLSRSRLGGGLTENWRIAQLGEIRSGLPFTVYQSQQALTRVNLVPGVNPLLTQPAPTAGGEVLLNRAAFAPAASGQVGNLGRNSLFGPGFWNLDLSLSRSFGLRWLGDSGQLQVRADAFNLLNHANLGNPNSLLGSGNFGVAQFGAIYPFSVFPPLTAFSPTARRIQLQLKLYF